MYNKDIALSDVPDLSSSIIIVYAHALVAFSII